MGKAKRTKIQLEPNDAAFVVQEDFGLQGYLPSQDGDDIVPDHVRLVAGLMILLNQTDTLNIIMQMIDEVFEENTHHTLN